MPSLTPPITTAKSGDIVVPISQIVDLLKSKLSQSDIDTLLSALLAGTGPQQVRPGDLITSDLINWVLAQISDLETRVAFLEGSVGKDGDVVIISLDPAGGNVKPGDTLKVNGKNFQFTQGLCRVFIDKYQVGFQPGSTDQQLILTVPQQITDIPASGRPALLTVSNNQSSAQAILFLRPAIALIGFFDLNEMDSKPSGATPKGGQPFTMVFQVASHVSLDTDVQVSAVVSGPSNAGDWKPIRILNPDETEIPNGTISLKQGASATVLVRIDPIPSGVPDGVAFSLDVQVAAGSITQKRSVSLTTSVAYVAPDPGILVNFASGQIVIGTGSVSGSLIQVATGGSAKLVFRAQFDKADSYPLNIGAPSGWKTSFDLTTNTANPFVVKDSDMPSGGGMASLLVSFFLYPDTGATSSGQLTLQLTRPGGKTGRSITPIPVQLSTT